MSVALFGKLTARYSHWNDIAVLMSSMSLAVSAGAVRPPPALLMPLLFDSSPPTTTVVCTSSPLHRVDRQAQQAVVEEQRVAGPHVARQLLVVEADALARAELGPGGVEDELLAGDERRLAAFDLADADLRALQVGHDRDLLADLGRDLADQRRAVDVVLRRAVREVEAHHVDAGADHPLEHLRRCSTPGRGWRRSWWRGGTDELSRHAGEVPGCRGRAARGSRAPAASCLRAPRGRRRRRSRCSRCRRRCRTWRSPPACRRRRRG